jgi:hypothetical protein
VETQQPSIMLLGDTDRYALLQQHKLNTGTACLELPLCIQWPECPELSTQLLPGHEPEQTADERQVCFELLLQLPTSAVWFVLSLECTTTPHESAKYDRVNERPQLGRFVFRRRNIQPIQ